MTEDEAKTKWCPFARIHDGDPPVSVNRPEPYADVPKCLGSFCMAWRKTGVAKVENRRGQMVDRDIDGTGRWHYEGFCGLAGKP